MLRRRSTSGSEIDEAGGAEARLQIRQSLFANAAHLQVAAGREADRAVAVGKRDFGDNRCLIEC